MGTCLDRLKRQVPSLPRKTPISTPILPLVVDPVHHFVFLLWPSSLYFLSFSLYAYTRQHDSSSKLGCDK